MSVALAEAETGAKPRPMWSHHQDSGWTIRNPRVSEQYRPAVQENRTLDDPMPIPEMALGNGVVLRQRCRPGVPRSRAFSVRLEDGCYTAHFVPAIDVPISAYSRVDLVSAVEDVIAVLWKKYANAPDETLWPSAQRLKRRLRRCYEEHDG